jgi:hypothetical protein
MIVTLTTSLPFGSKHALLEMQAEACTPTKTLNGTQTAITSGTFEQQWGLDATGNWKSCQAGQRRQWHMGTQMQQVYRPTFGFAITAFCMICGVCAS